MIQERKARTQNLYYSFKNLFGKDQSVKLCEKYELMLAETILINQVLKAKGHITRRNYQYAIDVLKREHGLNHNDIKQLFMLANDPQEQRPTLRESASIVRSQFGQKRLAALLEGLWLVAVANGKIAPLERSSITSIAHAVGLNDSENRTARRGAVRRSRVMQTY